MAVLDGKVVLVTGAGRLRGIGRATAVNLAELGADVVVTGTGRDPATYPDDEKKAGWRDVESTAEQIRTRGRRALTWTGDVSQSESVNRLVDQIVKTFGRLDVLVNNAFADGDHRRFLDADLDRWRATMDVNFFGTLQLTQAVAPHMVSQGDGRIVMINSMSAVRMRPGFGAYTGSKAALAAVTKILAAELGQHGIRVNGVHPGYIWGDSVEMYFDYLAGRKGITPEEQYRAVADETALRYLPPSSEIAEAVVFFASDQSKPITGQALGVNAGHWFQGF
jgi:NAD(P)-dependent dehydrogenase (short-subunit alcohol dehydrogenase family)